jgi:hypothetical protein
MNTFYAFKHKLTQVIASREVIVAAVSDIHGISIDARAPVTLMVDGLEDAPSSWKRFLRTTVRVGENHYPLGFAVGYFDPGEILGRAILGSPHAHQLGPRIGPFVDDDILAVELVRGKTIGQLMDGGHWEQAYSAQLRAAFELENLGLRAWDWTTWGNIIVEEGTERARIIDHRDVGFQENPPMPSLMPFKIMTNWFLSCVDMSLEPFNADLIQRFESRAQWMAEELADMAVREWGGKSVSRLLASGEIDHVLSHWNQETNPRRPLRDAAVAALRNAFADAARRAA